ncbi:TIGR04282 family arsenosugar biosynthesis glycosyltransferase [Phytoactinopolyspora endophytica]|uniref:TIGR04282 family arsenosugar biosynthesis glycosyltransferase n=1 Tax=Phytoactinopolyspora endophytica TaxID=1642495 RepID=UPI00197C0A4C|nr:DUF2064 domain-containing protein [Phytoactinopolyspora endophytica]
MPIMSGEHVLVLAKAPAPGRSKTRLSPVFGPVQAAAIAEAALADTLDAVARCNVERKIIALDGEPGLWLPPGFDVVPQVSGTLNERLAAAWAYADGPGLQIGMDTPQVTPELLERSLAAVDGHGADAALGLAKDGGWWAIALRGPHPEAFRDVPMSRPDTGRRQHARLRSLGLDVALLPMLQDLDDADDARAVTELIPGSRTASAVRDAYSSLRASSTTTGMS